MNIVETIENVTGISFEYGTITFETEETEGMIDLSKTDNFTILPE